jgi:hypothetical protein
MAEGVEGRTGTPLHRRLGPPSGTGLPREETGDGELEPAGDRGGAVATEPERSR